jgi:hypothetical protein
VAWFRVHGEPLVEGQVLDLSVCVEAAQLFPGGVTRFGLEYLAGGPLLPEKGISDAEIDLLFEFIRRAEFCERPSRYQSIFACESIEDARSFRDASRVKAAIWEVEGEVAFRADHNLLHLSGTALEVVARARRYWRGEQGVSPLWELLLRPPVTIIQQVG